MGTRGIKICKGCRRSFEPQLTDDEIFELWFTEEEIEEDQRHEEMTGHSHLEAPVQDLCQKCASDPDLVPVRSPFTGETTYRRKSKMKKVQVARQEPPAMQFGGPVKDHKVKASDGTEFTVTGPFPPPQNIVDLMAGIAKEAERQHGADRKEVLENLGEALSDNKKKRPWWRFWK